MSARRESRIGSILLLIALFAQALTAAERINHEGRILGTAPVVTNASLFNTSQADAVMSALQIYPREYCSVRSNLGVSQLD